MNEEWSSAHELPSDIAVAVAGAGAAVGDVAHDRAGIAADLFRRPVGAGIVGIEAFGKLAHRASLRRRSPPACGSASPAPW